MKEFALNSLADVPGVLTFFEPQPQKKNFAPRLGAAWDVGEKGQTVVRANWGRFYDRNLLLAAATVPEKGGIFTRSAFDVALPRLGSDYTDSLIDLVITSGFPTGPGTRGPAENPAYVGFANDLRRNPLALYNLLGIAVPNILFPYVREAVSNVISRAGFPPFLLNHLSFEVLYQQHLQQKQAGSQPPAQPSGDAAPAAS
jgi:hypothetical protein